MSDITTVADAKVHLRENWEKGVNCPCCGQLVKLYKRTLNGGIVINLIRLFQYDEKHPGEYMHVYSVMKQGGDLNMEYAKLGWWDLIEKKDEPDYDGDKKFSGLWRITAKGRQFVNGEITVPKRVHIYNNHRVGFDEDHVTIIEALGKKFSYKELMERQ